MADTVAGVEEEGGDGGGGEGDGEGADLVAFGWWG